MFTPIFGTSMLLYLYENGITIPEDAVLIFECRSEPMPADIMNRFINHGCTSSEYLQLIDMLAVGNIVTVSGDYYTGKNRLESVTVQQFIDEQVTAGRKAEFAERIAKACDFLANRGKRRIHGRLFYVPEF